MPVATVTFSPFVGNEPAENPSVRVSFETDAVKLGNVPTPVIGVTLAVFTATVTVGAETEPAGVYDALAESLNASPLRLPVLPNSCHFLSDVDHTNSSCP
mgnify:CR=1 FL=1